MKMIKHTNDFILGIALIIVGGFIMLSPDIVSNIPKMGSGGFIARADVYIRALATLLVVVSVLLIIRAINWKKSHEVKPFSFVLNLETVLTAIALSLYTLLLPTVGFFATTITLIAFLVILFGRREMRNESAKRDRQAYIKLFVVAIVYSLILTFVLYFAFTRFLMVTLP